MCVDRRRVGKNSVDRDQGSNRRKHGEKNKERYPGGDGNDPVLANRALEKARAPFSYGILATAVSM